MSHTNGWVRGEVFEGPLKSGKMKVVSIWYGFEQKTQSENIKDKKTVQIQIDIDQSETMFLSANQTLLPVQKRNTLFKKAR